MRDAKSSSMFRSMAYWPALLIPKPFLPTLFIHVVKQFVDSMPSKGAPSITKVDGFRWVHLFLKCSNATLKRHDVLSQLRDVLMQFVNIHL